MTDTPRPLRGAERHRIAARLATRFAQDNRSIRELAAEIGRRPCTVRNLLIDAGVEAYTTTACIGPSQTAVAAELARRYQTGFGVEVLSDDTGIDPRRVRALLRQAGLTLPRRRTSPVDRTPDIVQAYSDGASVRQIAADLGVSYSAIRKILQRANRLRARGAPRREPRPASEPTSIGAVAQTGTA
ncbi:helix-turn-helix domain-containing protein [Lentzea sp. NPDC042327]|uniref:helix-turn-helix domain-containing protein n=1 Tax=Lentzea sp. NPDC042327 TaxID=3154801 RepID=UPI0033CA7F91